MNLRLPHPAPIPVTDVRDVWDWLMIGCMIESSLAITAAAHLTPLVDYADLDGHLLIDNDPYEGVKVVNGKLMLPDAPGLGVRKTQG